MMKNAINKFLRKFGAELHGVGYIEKLKNSRVDKDEFIKQSELLDGKANIIFDVGANRGDIVSKYLEIFPNSQLHAFEPFPESYELFSEKHKGKKNVHLNKYALSSTAGKASMYVNKSVDTNSLLQSGEIGSSSDKLCVSVGQIEIETNTIDLYCKTNNISNIDILKLDVQGFELEVLKGASAMLEKGAIKLIYAEVFFQKQYVDQPLFHDIAAFLYQNGFGIHDIYNPYFSLVHMLWCETIFVHKGIIKKA